MTDDSSSIENFRQRLLESDLSVKGVLQELSIFKGTQQQLDVVSRSCREKLQTFEGLIDNFESLVLTKSTSATSNNKQQKQVAEQSTEECSKEIQKNRLECARNLKKFQQLTVQQTKLTQERSRTDLFTGGRGETIQSLRHRPNSLLKETSQVTDRLSNLLSEVSQQVLRSEQNIGVLAGGSETLKQTEAELHNMGGVIKTSGRLLTKYGSRECTDKLLLLLCLLMFYGVCFYIFRKRIF